MLGTDECCVRMCVLECSTDSGHGEMSETVWSGSDRLRLGCTSCSAHCTAAASYYVILECVAAFVMIVMMMEMKLSITSM